MVANSTFYISLEDYLEAERVSPIKHEYRQGRVYAMVGAKKPHVIIGSRLPWKETGFLKLPQWLKQPILVKKPGFCVKTIYGKSTEAQRTADCAGEN